MAGSNAERCAGRGSARLRGMALLSLIVAGASGMRGQAPEAAGTPMTSARAIHSLSAEEAARGLPVRFRGVVTFYDVPTHSLFVSDSSGGIYLWVAKGLDLPVTSGTVVEVTGSTQPGDFASIVTNVHLRVLGRLRHPLSAPRVTVVELATGRYDCRLVELDGLIRGVSRAGHMVSLKIVTRDGAILALTPAKPGEDYERLIDAKVRVRGVAAVEYNKHRQMTGSHLFLASLAEVRVLRRARVDPYALPVRSIGQLAQFDLHLKPADRVHVRGRVVLQWPGRMLCVQDATGGLCVETQIPEVYRLGSSVDVVGYPVFAAQIPALSDVVVRAGSEESALPVSARAVSAQEALEGEQSGQLVSIEGELVGMSSDGAVWQLTIASQRQVFNAILPMGGDPGQDGNWRVGSYVRVVGVCVNEVDARVGQDWVSAQKIAAFRLILRRPLDVTVLRKPSWWTPVHTSITLGAVVLVTLAVFGWVMLLRRRVEHRTQELRESERRFRHLAHHDSLTGVPNRAWFQERAEMALALSQRRGGCVGLLLLDLDRFKQVNDTLGHDAGDAMLCALAERVTGAVRKVDTVARLGGDEFAVVLADVSGGDDAEMVAQKILAAVCRPVTIANQPIAMSVSIGVAVFPLDGANVTELLRSADLAMYESKKLARGGVRRYRREVTMQEVEAMTAIGEPG